MQSRIDIFIIFLKIKKIEINNGCPEIYVNRSITDDLLYVINIMFQILYSLTKNIVHLEFDSRNSPKTYT